VAGKHNIIIPVTCW